MQRWARGSVPISTDAKRREQRRLSQQPCAMTVRRGKDLRSLGVWWLGRRYSLQRIGSDGRVLLVRWTFGEH